MPYFVIEQKFKERMRVCIVTVITLLMSSVMSFSQDLYYGPKVGFNFSKIGGGVDTRFKPGLVIGGTMQYSILENIKIGVDALISGQGANAYDSRYTNSKWKYTYLRLPIYGLINVTDKLMIEGGPQIAYLLSHKYQWGPNEYNLRREQKKIDLLI